MRIISFNSIYISYYFKNSIFNGISLCGNAYHVLSMLKDKFDVTYIGNVDAYLKDMIDVNYVSISNHDNNKIFINDKKISYYCPYCNRNRNQELKLNISKILENTLNDDILVIDDINDETIEFINNINNKAFLIMDSINEIRNYSLDEIRKMFNSRFESITLDVNVYHFLKDKFNIDNYELFSVFNPKLMIIFRGKKGADFIFLDNIIEKEIEDNIDDVDKIGGISAFSAVFIEYLINNNKLDEKIISSLFIKANLSYIKTINRMGLNKLYKIDKYDECICNNFIIK